MDDTRTVHWTSLLARALDEGRELYDEIGVDEMLSDRETIDYRKSYSHIKAAIFYARAAQATTLKRMLDGGTPVDGGTR